MPAKAALTSASRLTTKLAGSVAGYGLLDDVADLYAYLMRTLRERDEIFIFGFSRGAFTARVLAGLIHRCGVLKPDFTDLIPYALDLYRPHNPVEDVVEKFVKLFSQRWRVHCLGLWDTVKAFGVIWPKSLPHLRFNSSADIVRHAMALEERRTMFDATTWGGTDGDGRGTPAGLVTPAMPPRFIERNQNVKEVWFAGCHSDVGGEDVLKLRVASTSTHSSGWSARHRVRGSLSTRRCLMRCFRSQLDRRPRWSRSSAAGTWRSWLHDYTFRISTLRLGGADRLWACGEDGSWPTRTAQAG